MRTQNDKKMKKNIKNKLTHGTQLSQRQTSLVLGLEATGFRVSSFRGISIAADLEGVSREVVGPTVAVVIPTVME